MGKLLIDNIAYSTSFHDLKIKLELTDEFRSILLFDDAFPAQDFYDLKSALSHLHIEGTYIELEDLVALRDFIQAVIHVFVYFKVKNDAGKYPQLWNLSSEVVLEKDLLESINRIIDAKGMLRDNASEELRRIKSEINRISNSADRKIRKILNAAKSEGLVKEEAEMTIRNGRLCIPVPAQFKRRLKGFIHDESATGQTVFIEPTEVFDANNELKDLINAEKREIVRILTVMADEIRPSIDNLRRNHDYLGEIDFIRAKAKWAVSIHAILPNLFDYPIINWQNAIHPLLFLNFQGTEKKVQPLDIQLNNETRILIISGPNAGGKSVCLKSVGLIQYMLQCGLLVPVKETSDMGVFSDFFIDMGDEQSIDNDLSTYSSHLKNLKVMYENMNSTSLFLIDEFGSGTEPTLGGAMAEAILESFYQLHSFGIITTHYGNLKVFSDHHHECANGAMLFDTNALKPLFILKTGKPGSSFTYEIARQIGLPDTIIEAAIAISGTAQIDYEKKLEEIEIEKIEIDNTLKAVNSADDQLAKMIEEYGVKFGELEKQRKVILQKAKNQATSIIDSANKMIEKTIREIKEAKAEGEKTKAARKEVSAMKQDLQKEIESIENEEVIKPIVPLRKKTTPSSAEKKEEELPLSVGDSVLLAEIQTIGEVMAINGDEVTVSFNSISFRTSLQKVSKISQREARTVKRTGTRLDGGTLADAMNKKVAAFSTTIDLRGKRADDAIQELTLYLDEASLLGVKQIKVLHGKGNGILRHVVRQFLSKQKEVKSFCDEALELGGYGITVVTLS